MNNIVIKIFQNHRRAFDSRVCRFMHKKYFSLFPTPLSINNNYYYRLEFDHLRWTISSKNQIKKNHLHAVSCTQQCKKGNLVLRVKTFHPSLSAEFWRHYMLSGGTQRRAWPWHQSEEVQNYYYTFIVIIAIIQIEINCQNLIHAWLLHTVPHIYSWVDGFW